MAAWPTNMTCLQYEEQASICIDRDPKQLKMLREKLDLSVQILRQAVPPS